MSISTILDIGSKALMAQKTAIDVTGQNISNVNTPGYSRQSVNLESSAGTIDPRFFTGNGVNVASVQRAQDNYLQTQILGESGFNGNQSALQSALATVEPLFNETANTGLSSSLQEFFTAWQDLSVNPQGTTERQAVLDKSQSVVDNFHRISTGLNDQLLQANNSLPSLTTGITTNLKQIADYNAQIKSIETGGGSANQLRDSRDLLLKSISQKVGISTQEQSDGTVTVTLGSSSGGPTLVSGVTSSILTTGGVTPNASSILLKSSSTDPGTDVTSLIAADTKSGTLGGTLQVRDQIIPGFLGSLDEAAYNLATEVNSVHSSGYGLTGGTGLNLFTPPASPTPPATYTSGYSSIMGVSITSTNDLAAASLPGATGNNVNALSLAALQTKAITVSGSQTTLPGLYNSLVGKVGVTVQNNTQAVSQSSSMLTQLDNLRESTLGVALDEELMKLLSYQKAYEGAAKLITTASDMIDTVLGMVR